MVHRDQPANISIQTSLSYEKEVLTLKRKNTQPLLRNVITLENNNSTKKYSQNQPKPYPPWSRFLDFRFTDAKITEGPINKRTLGHTCAFQIPRPILFSTVLPEIVRVSSLLLHFPLHCHLPTAISRIKCPAACHSSWEGHPTQGSRGRTSVFPTVTWQAQFQYYTEAPGKSNVEVKVNSTVRKLLFRQK